MQRIISILLPLFFLYSCARDGFAIVIDPQSYANAKEEVDAYADALHDMDGYTVYVVEDVWGVPDSLRARLLDLHRERRAPITGCVFVGDIPIPMIRDAQHLASAFKMDQDRYARHRSSIPSDRFYDDFDLVFNPLGKDEGKPYFYYSLAPESPQKLSPDIFSGRIRPVNEDGTVRYDALRAYLLKAVEAKRNPRRMEQLMYFGGHGYVSESKTARIDEKRVWLEHFPYLQDGRNHIGFIDYSDVVPVKKHLMDELMRPDLDVAVLHHHGSPGNEYLNAVPRPYMVKDTKEYMLKTFRDHLWKAKDRGRDYNRAKQDLKKRFDLPESWFEDIMNPETHRSDSLNDASLDLYLEDFAAYGYRPNAQLVILDACFNGSFHLADCIADEYIFQPGGTIAVQANTVNSLQDKWHDRFFGLVACGGCAGDLARYAPYIESHIIGDPTFRFRSENTRNIDRIILKDRKCTWRRLLRSGIADEQALAIEHLVRKCALDSDALVRIYRKSPYATVRLQALTSLAAINGPQFTDILPEAAEDSDEFIRRMAVKYMGRSGAPALVPAIVKAFLTNNPGSRIKFNTDYALGSFDTEAVLEEFDRQVESIPMVMREEETVKLRKSLEKGLTRWDEDFALVTDSTCSFKERRNAIRQLRSYIKYGRIPEILSYLHDCGEPQIQVLLLEALGWHTLAWNADTVAATALEMSGNDGLAPEVRSEALRTFNRLAH